MRILSLFDCNLESIVKFLPEIKHQGFDAVQISPLQNTKDDSSREWWMLYQPINFNIGNRIGDRDSLKYLCEEAKKYGITIIADAVFNHLASINNIGSIRSCIYLSTNDPIDILCSKKHINFDISDKGLMNKEDDYLIKCR